MERKNSDREVSIDSARALISGPAARALGFRLDYSSLTRSVEASTQWSDGSATPKGSGCRLTAISTMEVGIAPQFQDQKVPGKCTAPSASARIYFLKATCQRRVAFVKTRMRRRGLPD
jgi:hypothetical protein